MADKAAPSLDLTLDVLRAAAEETRLRILALLAEGELSVSDLTDILGQSQPRISRHLKLLVEAGLVERHREGAWAFFRLTDRGVACASSARPSTASTGPIRSCWRTGRGSKPCARSARRRRRPSSPASPPNGTASAPCMRPRRWSRRPCSMPLGRGRSAISSISAPAPAACCSSWHRAPPAPSGSMPAMPCSPSPAPISKRRA